LLTKKFENFAFGFIFKKEIVEPIL